MICMEVLKEPYERPSAIGALAGHLAVLPQSRLEREPELVAQRGDSTTYDPKSRFAMYLLTPTTIIHFAAVRCLVFREQCTAGSTSSCWKRRFKQPSSSSSPG